MKNIIEKTYDVVVIGSGGAGSAAASEAAQHGARVLVVSKDPLACSDSKISEGIVTVRESGDESDNEQNLFTNMRMEGSDMGDPDLVNRFAEDSVDAYQWLQRWGQRANQIQDTNKPVHVALGGHNKPRSVIHPQGGLDYGHSIWNAVLQSQGSISYIEDAWCLEVITDQSPSPRVLGCVVYHAASGELWNIKAGAVLLACGGLSTLYFPNTDTMRGNTGDGYAIAARSGCELVDMEQVQFIPFALVGPKAFEGLVVGEPASAGPLGVLRDRNGNILMSGLMRRNRAEVSAAIALAVEEGRGTQAGGCYLDMTQNVEGKAGENYYQIFSTIGHAFINTVKSALGPKASLLQAPWEVRPSAHYCMGGVRVSADGESSGVGAVTGLLAAGQVLGGLHGGNRLGSTSLAEGIIFGRRAGRRAAEIAARSTTNEQDWRRCAEPTLQHYQQLGQRQGKLTPSELTLKLQQVSWRYLGPVRTQAGIQQGINELAAIREQLENVSVSNQPGWNQSLIDYIELVNMLTCAEMIAQSALQRPNSVGAHVIKDASPSPLINRKPYSLSIRQSHNDTAISQTSNWQLQKLIRQPTPLLPQLHYAFTKQASILGLKLLRKLPQKQLDRILNKTYTKLAKSMGVSLTTGTSTEISSEKRRALSVSKRIQQTHDAVTFQFKTDKLVTFLAGQFGNFHFNINNQTVMRSYSFSSSPSQNNHLEITIKREPGGLVSNWAIDHLQEGDKVEMSEPKGKFCIPAHGAPQPPAKLLLIGAGSGITPLLSMMRWIADSNASTQATLLYSVRTQDDVMFADELLALSNQHPQLQVYITYTGTAETISTGKHCAQGRLTDALLQQWVPDLAERHTYICGPSAFMEHMQTLCINRGLAKRKCHVENFSAELDLSAFSHLDNFSIEFTRSGVTLQSTPGASLLDAAEQENLDTNFSCRSGTCGECKTRLVSGDVHMVCDDGLSSSEKREGMILTCSAVPLSDCQLEA